MSEMTREEAKEVFLNRGFIEVDGGEIYDGEKWREACIVISEWLKQEPCGDAISRQSTLKPYEGLKDDDVIAVWLIRKNIEQQLSVNPQEPKTDVLDKIRAEIMSKDGLEEALEIIQKAGNKICPTRKS